MKKNRPPSCTVIEVVDKLIARRSIDSKGCWNYTGAIGSNGYGTISFKTKTVTIHRLIAYICLGFNLNSKLYVCHKCDNKKCFNPTHLFIGTCLDNHLDRIKKGLWSNRKGWVITSV